jgi:hypothetical protein
MLQVHCTQVAVFQKVSIVYFACLGLIKLLNQFLNLSVRNFHLCLRQTPDECLIRQETSLFFVRLRQQFLEAFDVVGGHLLAEVLQSSVLDLGLNQDFVDSLEDGL